MTPQEKLANIKKLVATNPEAARRLAVATTQKKAEGGLKGLIAKTAAAAAPISDPVARARIQKFYGSLDAGDMVTSLIRNPALKGLAFIVPVTAPFIAAATAADKLVSAIKQGDPMAAMSAAATAAAAAAGDSDAARALNVLKQKGLDTALGVAKAAKDTAMPAIKTMQGIGAHFSIPVNAPALPIAKAADKLLSAAAGDKGAVAKNTAISLVKQTVVAAKKGDASAKRGLVALTKTEQARRLKGLKSGFRSATPLATAAKKPPGKAKLAKRPTVGTTYRRGFLVDAKGIVYRGDFQAK